MFELFIGAMGAAIAISQVLTEEKAARQKQIFVSTLVGSVIIATAGFGYAISSAVHYYGVYTNSTSTLKGLNEFKTYDELLKIGNLDFSEGDDVISYLNRKKLIDIDFPNMTGPDGKSHIVRVFRKKQS
jgi:hypothetical protein